MIRTSTRSTIRPPLVLLQYTMISILDSTDPCSTPGSSNAWYSTYGCTILWWGSCSHRSYYYYHCYYSLFFLRSTAPDEPLFIDLKTSVIKIVTAIGIATAVTFGARPLQIKWDERRTKSSSPWRAVVGRMAYTIWLMQVVSSSTIYLAAKAHPSSFKSFEHVWASERSVLNILFHIIRNSIISKKWLPMNIWYQVHYSFLITSNGLVSAAPAMPAAADLRAER